MVQENLVHPRAQADGTLRTSVATLTEKLVAYTKVLGSDFLSEPARRLRRNLLAASTLTLGMTFGGLIPSTVQQLGLTFSDSNRASLVMLAAAICAYHSLGLCEKAGTSLRHRRWAIIAAHAEVLTAWHSFDSIAEDTPEGPEKSYALGMIDDLLDSGLGGLQISRSLAGSDARPPGKLAFVKPTTFTVDVLFPVALGIIATASGLWKFSLQ